MAVRPTPLCVSARGIFPSHSQVGTPETPRGQRGRSGRGVAAWPGPGLPRPRRQPAGGSGECYVQKNSGTSTSANLLRFSGRCGLKFKPGWKPTDTSTSREGSPRLANTCFTVLFSRARYGRPCSPTDRGRYAVSQRAAGIGLVSRPGAGVGANTGSIGARTR